MIAIVILLRVLRKCRSGGEELSNVRSFTILLSGEGLTSLSILTLLACLVKKSKMKLLKNVKVKVRVRTRSRPQI